MFNSKHYTILGLYLFFSLGQANAGSLTISERIDGGTNTGYYSVTNDGLADIKFFAVGHVNANTAMTSFGKPSPTQTTFVGATYSETTWDAVIGFPIGVSSGAFKFDDYFETDDNVVNAYYDGSGNGFGIADGDDTTDLFSYLYNSGTPLTSSLWLAVDVNGGVHTGMTTVATVNAVPLPAAAVLFAPALLGFLGFRRKLQA